MRARVMAMVSLGVLLVGCQGTDSQNSPIAAQSANLVCAGYGLRIGKTAFNDCVAYQETRNPGQAVPPYRMDQYNNRVDAEGCRRQHGPPHARPEPLLFPWGPSVFGPAGLARRIWHPLRRAGQSHLNLRRISLLPGWPMSPAWLSSASALYLLSVVAGAMNRPSPSGPARGLPPWSDAVPPKDGQKTVQAPRLA
jgi:hypothetical protein